MAHHNAQPQYTPPQPSHYHQQQPTLPQQNYPQQQPAGYAPPSSNPQYAQPPPSPRFLHIYEEGLTHRHRLILDSDKSTPLYTITANSGGALSSKPHVTITSASTNNAIIGTITFHTISNHVDLTIHNQSLSFKSHEFRSLATGGNFEWKKEGIISGGDMVCVDERKRKVAWYENSKLALHKDGKIGLEAGGDGMLVDEIVVTLIAMIELKRRENARSAAAG